MKQTNALIKSRKGRVFHYGYYNEAMEKWYPSCGQCVAYTTPLNDTGVIEGVEIKVCKNCLNHQLPEEIFRHSGLTKDVSNIFRVSDPDTFEDSRFVVPSEQVGVTVG